jgi:hypothetical protein
MPDDKELYDNEKWKDELSFISGNILVWGLVVLNFWPIVSHFQTGIDYHLGSRSNITTEVLFFGFWTMLLAMAISVILMAIAHIFSRGIWLILSNDSKYRTILGSYCKTQYDIAILFLIYMGAGLFLGIFYDVVYLGVVKLFVSWSIPFAEWITSLLILIINFLILYIFIHIIVFSPSISIVFSDLEEYYKERLKAISLSLVVFFVLYLITIEACYTMDLTVNGKIFDRTRGDIIEVYVGLGGATSDANVTKLKLLDSSGTLINNLPMYFIGQGQYASYIQSSTLLGGRYEVALEYPSRLLSSSYPFVGSKSRESLGFVVIS